MVIFLVGKLKMSLNDLPIRIQNDKQVYNTHIDFTSLFVSIRFLQR